ncbi:hypothetical protein N7488_002200 [Penicillium malachiteum]|nr:hypothetical protein N7488_002200 [Penicillium malachiteum]
MKRWRDGFQPTPPSPNAESSELEAQQHLCIATTSTSQQIDVTDDSNSHLVVDHSRRSTNTACNEAPIRTSQTLVRHKSLDPTLIKSPEYFGDLGAENSSSDIWSMSSREAVESFDTSDLALLEGKNVYQLLKNLEEIETTPLATIEPVATTVVGLTKSVTAIAMSFASVDLQFAKQIAEMLEQIEYIDKCDTLGQKTDCEDIHKALVSVYQKILEFYKAAFEILTRKGVKLILNMVVENERLPSIVQEFLSRSDVLRKLISKAILEITDDIKKMVYDREIYAWLGGDVLKQ